MSEQELVRIRDWISQGAKLYIGSDPAGRRKIKVVRGPMGLWTKRYQCSEADVAKLRVLLAGTNSTTAA